jgi:AcrR family transcriptional regulator
MANERLAPEDWTRAALAAIASGGIGAVSVEALVPVVGASKGSFYWHFQSRSALLDAALVMWEETQTTDVIRVLTPVVDPRDRLDRLFAMAFDNPEAGRVEAALISQPEHPSIKTVLGRVTRRRAAFITAAFTELGFDARRARFRALAAYSAYLGLYTVPRAFAGTLASRREMRTAYLRELLDMLTAR